MHDIRAIRDDPGAFDRAWESRGLEPQTARILELDAVHRRALAEVQEVQAHRNDVSRRIGLAKAQRNEPEAQRLLNEVESFKSVISEKNINELTARQDLEDYLATLPNLPAPDVPRGQDEQSNVELRRWGEPFAIPSPKDHVDLGADLGLMDFEAAARMSGSRFVVLRSQLARLERALGQFMLDYQTEENGYTEISPPLLVNDNAMFGTGQLPKFGEDLFFYTHSRSLTKEEWRVEATNPPATSHQGLFWKSGSKVFVQANTIFDVVSETLSSSPKVPASDVPNLLVERTYEKASESIRKNERNYWLIPTAEVSLTNLVREQITAEEELPLRLTALTPCFRSEAGASGKDTRGMIRQHQFNKVELVSITTPEQSEAEHERMVACAEGVLKRLELPFRTMLLCTGDMGFASRKTYDLEVWLPSQGIYREISSCSNCGDFQARRMDARCRKAGEKGTRFVHTLNGSGLAVGRTLVALMENYQDDKGRIAIPQALHRYLPGLHHIGGEG
jgi:seryl-tRNA synthetase